MKFLRTKNTAIFIVIIALLLAGTTAFAQRPDIQWMRGGFEYHGDAAPTPFYSSDGQYLLTYEYEGPSAKIFNVSNGLLLQTIIPNFTDWITAAALSPDSQLFALSGTGASGPEVLIYSFPAGNFLYTLPTSFVPYTLSFSPDDALLAIGSPSFQGGYFTITNGVFTPATVLEGSPVVLTGSPQFMLGGLAFTYAQANPSEVYPGLWTGPVTFPWSNWSDWPGYIYGLTSPLSSVGPYIAGNNGVVYALDSGCPEPGTQCDPPPPPIFAPSNSTSPGNGQNSSALSPDGSYLAVASNNYRNYAWSATLQTFATGTWTPGPSIALPTLAAGQIGLSPDSTAIALGDPMIQILNAHDLSVQSTIAYDWNLVSSVAYSPDGTFVVSGDLDGQAIAWNTADGSLRYLLQSAVPGSQTQVDSVSIAPNGQLIAVGVNGTASNRGSINVYSASSGVLQLSIPVSTNGSYLSIAFLNDTEIVATASSGGAYIVIYSATTGKPVRSVADPCQGGPAGLSAFPNGKSIVVSCPEAVIVNISTGKFTTLAEPVDTAILAIAVSPNSKYVAVGLNDYSDPPSVGRVQLFSAATGALVDTYIGSNSSVFSVAFSSDSETIAAGSANGFLNFWSISSPDAPEQTYNQETGDSNTTLDAPNVSAIAYSSDNEHVYYGRNDASSVLIDNPIYIPLASLDLSKSSVIGGATASGTVALTVPAPSYGAKVFLTSSDSAAAEVPASVTVPAGQTSATFRITTTAQTSTTSVTISANSTGTVQAASLTVVPQPTLIALTLSPTRVQGGRYTRQNTVTLSSPAPTGGIRVTLSSSDTAVATTPASVVVSAGATVSSVFTISTKAVSATTNVTISATYDGATQQATLLVVP